MENYFISGTGLKMWIDGSAYQDPDKEIIRRAMDYEDYHANIVVKKLVGLKLEEIYKAEKATEKRAKRFGHCFCPQPRCNCHQHAYA